MTPSVNVASHLARMAAEQPDRPAIHVPARSVKPKGPSVHHTLTFAELNAITDAVAHGLTHAGIGRGTRTVLMVPPSPEFFALTFALFKIAAIPVMIDPGMGLRNLGSCLAEAEPEAFIGVPKAHFARWLYGWGKPTVRTTINVGRWRWFCDHSLETLSDNGLSHGSFTLPNVSPDDPAAVLFTSGSTGIAKGAEYTHGIFASQVEMLKATYGIQPSEIDLCTFPLFALFAPALGMTCVIPDMDFTRPASIDARKAVAQIDQFGVTNLFGSPAVIRAIGTWGLTRDWRKGVVPFDEEGVRRDERPTRLPTLRRVISAGAPANANDVECFARLISPGIEVFTPYGATEALPVANVGSREILTETRHLTDQGKGVCVGRPVAGMTVHVIRMSDDPIAEWDDSLLAAPGEVGEFVVRGPVVTKQYFRRPEATKLAKIHDPRTGETLHRMGDVGYFDEWGRMWFCGRKSHRVVTPWGTLFTDMVEPVFNTVTGVGRTALVGVKREGVTYPIVLIELSPSFADSTNWDKLKSALLEQRERYPHTARISRFYLYGSTFPVDVRHNSKIFREKLAVWADRELGPHWKPEEPS